MVDVLSSSKHPYIPYIRVSQVYHKTFYFAHFTIWETLWEVFIFIIPSWYFLFFIADSQYTNVAISSLTGSGTKGRLAIWSLEHLLMTTSALKCSTIWVLSSLTSGISQTKWKIKLITLEILSSKLVHPSTIFSILSTGGDMKLKGFPLTISTDVM